MAKGESERPEGCRYWNWPDVVKWIRTNVEDRSTLLQGVETVLWWKACRDSESISDMNSRERAEMFLDTGCEPPNWTTSPRTSRIIMRIAATLSPRSTRWWKRNCVTSSSR